MLLGEWLNGRATVSKTVGCVFDSRLPCQKQALCACFLFSKKRESESPRKAFANKCSPADANFVPLYFVYFRFYA